MDKCAEYTEEKSKDGKKCIEVKCPEDKKFALIDGKCVEKCDDYIQTDDGNKKCIDNKCADKKDTPFTKKDGTCLAECADPLIQSLDGKKCVDKCDEYIHQSLIFKRHDGVCSLESGDIAAEKQTDKGEVADADACEKLCLEVADAKCTAFQFNAKTKKCIVFTETGALKGKATDDEACYTKTANKMCADKKCADTEKTKFTL